MALGIRAHQLPVPVREFKFHPDRMWRFDFAWPTRLVALEVDGGIGTGRHSRLTGFSGDCDKANEAQMLGWIVLRVSALHVKAASYIDLLRRALNRP